MNMGFYIKFHPNQQLNEKAKTANNVFEAVQNTHSTCFIKSKNYRATVRPRIFKLDKTLLFVF